MIPVGGGKGGVGKTFLVANLASALARMGHRVVAVDGDLEETTTELSGVSRISGRPHPSKSSRRMSSPPWILALRIS